MLGNFKEWVMKKRFSLLWSLLAMVVVCACSKSGGSDYPDPEKAGLTFQVTFDKTGMEGLHNLQQFRKLHGQMSSNYNSYCIMRPVRWFIQPS